MAESRLPGRPHFFSGRLLTAEDLKQEQEYGREKLKRHNRSLHGFGIVSGLKVSTRAGQIVVEPGMALDCEGNEVFVETTQEVAPPLTAGDSNTSYVGVRYVERLCGSIPGPAGAEASTIEEGSDVVTGHENHNSGHRHLRARWLACGGTHPVTIAKLRRGPHGWRVDRAYRAPGVK